MNLIKYMPPFLKEVREFKEIFGAEDIQIEKLNNQINSMLREVIVKQQKIMV